MHTACVEDARPVIPGLRQVAPGSLIEKGDVYIDDRGALVPFSLEQVGRPVSAERPAYRAAGRPSLY